MQHNASSCEHLNSIVPNTSCAMDLKPLFLYIMRWEHVTWAVVIQSLWVLQHTTLYIIPIVSPLTGKTQQSICVYGPAWSIANRELEKLSSPIF
jgi:hypothetical protein